MLTASVAAGALSVVAIAMTLVGVPLIWDEVNNSWMEF
uniref:Uncharacterized protein n=1 Tax=Plectus sambesii TaxID=2011161 RepID=A0A914VN87_9BILA